MIQVSNLVKEYKLNKNKNGLMGLLKNDFEIKKAVNDVSFNINKGEMVGFIGPNGAGKSTTIKVLTGILHPTSGKVEINGIDPYKQRKQHAGNIGVVFGQKTQLWWDLPVTDTFDLLKSIYRVPNKVYKENLEIFHEILGIEEFKNQSVRQLSLGQRMRADIAAALLHNPEIIFFDEPTIGLDIFAKEKIREFLKFINIDRNITMLFTTHDMEDIEKICNRVIVIDQGKNIFDGSLETIRSIGGKEKNIIVELEEDFQIVLDGVKVMDLAPKTKKITFFNESITESLSFIV